MLEQYKKIKKEYPDSILFFRLGDFYEMFYEDAKIASRVLGIALTSRNKSKKNPIPLCGVPHHSAEPYLAKLLKEGHKVAICEQVDDPKPAKGVVRRKVVRVFSPGVILDSEHLDSKSNNYLASIYLGGDPLSNRDQESVYGLAYADISTGLFRTTSLDSLDALADEISRIEPKELLLQEEVSQDDNLLSSIIRKAELLITPLDSWIWDRESARELLLDHLSTRTLEPYGLEENPEATVACSSLVQYLKDTQLENMPLLNDPHLYQKSDFLIIDDSTKRNLEILQPIRGDSSEGSLIWVIDETRTAMGARLIKEWLNYPLIEKQKIEERLDSVAEFKIKTSLSLELESALKEIGDIERLIGRISTSSGRPRDLASIRDSSHFITKIRDALGDADSRILKEIGRTIDNFSDVRKMIEETIVENPPASGRDGGIIRDGFNAELDGLKSIRRDGKKWIAKLEANERESTGIGSLKVSYNRVFGYYIEVSKINLNSVPERYIRKQTLVNAERFITDNLKEYEEKILGAEDRIIDIERELFDEIRKRVANEAERIRRTSSLIAQVDVLCAFSRASEKNDYVRPIITDDKVIELKNNRHPVIERMRLGERFVPNDIKLDPNENQFLIITGPNMAGKSTLIRQVALTILMAQIGCFVPASYAKIGIADKIFSRVGASDNLARGQSTFMVEMVETAYILRHSTEKSLVILDEIGRGTSTFDGMSIAWAVAESLHDKGCRTLFATHYHELAGLALSKSRTKNYNIYVKNSGDNIVFLRKLVPGAASHSYGIHVAKLAGVPEPVIKSARKILSNLEKSQSELRNSILGGQTSLFKQVDENKMQEEHPIVTEIRELDVNSMTPLDALTKLAEVKKTLEKT